MMDRQPVAAGFGNLGGEDLDTIAASRLGGERHDAAVDLGAAAAMTDFRMDVVREIEHGGAAWHVDDFALGRKHVHAIFHQLGFETGGQFGIVFAAWLQQLAHPGDLGLEFRIGATAFLVAPVRGHAEFVGAMHLVRADLHFERLARRAEHGRMQRAITVALRPGDIVVEFAGQMRPQAVHEA